MPLTITLTDEQLRPFVTTQGLINAEISTVLPLEELVQIHIGAAHSTLLANEILATLTGKEYSLEPGEQPDMFESSAASAADPVQPPTGEARTGS